MICTRCHNANTVNLEDHFCSQCWRYITIAQSQYARNIINSNLMDAVWRGDIDDAIAAKHPWSVRT